MVVSWWIVAFLRCDSLSVAPEKQVGVHKDQRDEQDSWRWGAHGCIARETN